MKTFKIKRVSPEVIVTITGLGIIALGIVANAYSALTNLRFVHAPLDIIYYNRYTILLIGGFLIGWITSSRRNSKRIRDASIWALITMLFYPLLDAIRLPFGDNLGYPMGSLLFNGMPLIALFITALLAVVTSKDKRIPISNLILIAAFILGEIFSLYTIFEAYLTVNSNPPLTLIPTLLLEPITLAAAAYLVLSNISTRRDRLFYAGFVGAIATIFMTTFWELRTDPSADATNIFSAIAIALQLLVVCGLIASLRLANVSEGKTRLGRRRPQRSQR